VRPLVPALARRLLTVDQLSAIAKGSEWEDIGLPAVGGAVDGEWRYRCTKTRIVVEASPVGAGKVRWRDLFELVEVGLRACELPLTALAMLTAGRGPTPAKLHRAGLPEDADADDIADAQAAAVRAVIDRGVIALGGVTEQLGLFGQGDAA
jgi:hypothetical protein